MDTFNRIEKNIAVNSGIILVCINYYTITVGKDLLHEIINILYYAGKTRVSVKVL